MNARRYRYDCAEARRMVAQYRDRKATSAALTLLQAEILGYHAVRGWSYQQAAEDYAGRLVAHGVSPLTLLERLVAFYLVNERRPLATEREVAVALGRWLLSAAPFRRSHVREKLPSVNACREIGERARDALGRYAVAMILKDRADAETAAALRRDLTDFDTPSP